ncbi:putative virion structural protein [Salmonella phage SPFM20]|nr:putative virion structural protein [Salmonella phage SPFM20]
MAIIKLAADSNYAGIALQGARYMGITSVTPNDSYNEVVPLKFAYVTGATAQPEQQFTTDWAYNRAITAADVELLASKPQAEYVAYGYDWTELQKNLADVVTDVDLSAIIAPFVVKPGCLAWQGGFRLRFAKFFPDIVDQSVKDLGESWLIDVTIKLSELLPFLNAKYGLSLVADIEMEILFRNVIPVVVADPVNLLYGLNGKGYKGNVTLEYDRVATGFPESVQTPGADRNTRVLLDAINRQNGLTANPLTWEQYTLTTRRV